MRRRQRPPITLWPLEDVKLIDKVDNKDVKDEETTTTSDIMAIGRCQAQGQGRQESYISNIRKYQTKVEKEIDFKDFQFRISFPLD